MKHFSKPQSCIALAICIALPLLAACTATDSTLGVEGASNDSSQAASEAQFPTIPGETPSQSASAGTAQTATATAPQLPAGTLGSVRFAPVVGAPVDKVTALSRRLGVTSKSLGLKLEPSSSTAANYELRGYFSALAQNGSTTVIHVWDVFTLAGQRVHRIQGQESVTGTAPDPWSVVTPQLMETIADRVLQDYAAWRRNA